MTVTNVSTYGSLQTLLQNMGQVQSNLNDAQVQTSSGKKSQTFDGISSSVEQFTALNAQVNRLTDYQQSNGVIVGQLQTTNTALGQVTQLATSVKSLIASQLSGTTSSAAFSQQLQSELGTLTSILNTNYSGSYIFGGTNTSTPPVKTPVPANVQTGVPDAGYYQGSNQDSTVRISDSQTITPNISASNSAFQQLFAGIQQAISAASSSTASGSSSTRTAALTNAENLVDGGLQGSIALQATVNSNILTVQNATTQSQTMQTYYTGIVSNIDDSDVVALSTQVSEDTATLQASYSTFARISSLSLVNYLK